MDSNVIIIFKVDITLYNYLLDFLYNINEIVNIIQTHYCLLLYDVIYLAKNSKFIYNTNQSF